MRKLRRRILFIQATDAGGYPPIINASAIMAAGGWDVLVLNAPIADHDLSFPPNSGVAIRNLPERRSHVMGKREYARYVLAAGRLALTYKPDVVYASDPLGAAPARLAARMSGATLVYHEHDTPGSGALPPTILRQRAKAAKSALLVVFPNHIRARIAQQELGFRDEQLRIVWNLPRLNELPPILAARPPELALYYHGSITPERLPETVIDAVVNRCVLRIAGYEAPGAPGYVQRLVSRGSRAGGDAIQYVGKLSRDRVLGHAAKSSVGLALLPKQTTDLNLAYMLGASNKVFDYMAAGLALLVPDLPDWENSFVEPGYGRACDPADTRSISAQLDWFAAHPEERLAMGERGRRQIENEWNYEKAFQPVLHALEDATCTQAVAAE